MSVSVFETLAWALSKKGVSSLFSGTCLLTISCKWYAYHDSWPLLLIFEEYSSDIGGSLLFFFLLGYIFWMKSTLFIEILQFTRWWLSKIGVFHYRHHLASYDLIDFSPRHWVVNLPLGLSIFSSLKSFLLEESVLHLWRKNVLFFGWIVVELMMVPFVLTVSCF